MRQAVCLAFFLLPLCTPGMGFASNSKETKSPTLSAEYDIVVAGGGMGGIAAAIQAARLGASVLVAEPCDWIGGQALAAGVSTMDDLSRIQSGLYLEFITRLREHYGSRNKSMGTCYWDSRSVAFEPHLGESILYELAAEARKKPHSLDIFLNAEVTEVRRDGKSIQGVTVKHLNTKHNVACQVLIDATEYGDVIPLAGASYRVGNSTYPFLDPSSMVQDITWVAILKKYPHGVPENLRPKHPLPGYDTAKRNYESYVTADGKDFKGVYPVSMPVNFVSHNAYRGLPDSSTPWSYDGSVQNWRYITKCGLNWGNDYPGKYGWNGKRGLPIAYIEDRKTRGEIEKEALLKTLHFIYYMQNELKENWSVADDEYHHVILPKAAEGLPDEWAEIARRMPPIPYVRESRRIVGEYTLTSAEILKNSLSYRDGQTSHEFSDAIAIGGYILDLHGADTDADMEWTLGEKAASGQLNRPRGPFQVPMRVLIPAETNGLLAAEKNLSVSRLSAGALRLQPICMMTGQAAGALAALAVKEKITLRDFPAVRVQSALLNEGVVLSLCRYKDVPPEHPFYKAVQLSNLYGLIAPKEPPHAPSYNISDLDDPVLAMAIIKGNDKGIFGVDDLIIRQEMVSMINKAREASGTPNGTPLSSPEKADAFVNRGYFARSLCSAFGIPLRDDDAKTTEEGLFRASDHPQAVSVAALAELGVLDLYRSPDQVFHYGRPVTRGEAAEMLRQMMTKASLKTSLTGTKQDKEKKF